MSEANRRRPATEPREACCLRCNQTFLPADPAEPIHFQRRDGELCGGEGRYFRPFVIRNDPNRW
jgi:hypothetical protein